MANKIISPEPWKLVKRATKRAIEGGQRGKGGKSFKADGANIGINRNKSGSQYENGTSGRGKGPHRDNRSGSAMAWDKFSPDISAHPARKGRNPQGSKEVPKMTKSEPKRRSFKGANAGPGGKTRYRPGGGNR
jgi:hypothetical protein